MADINRYIKDARAVNSHLQAPADNSPAQYAGRGRQYFATAASRFYQEYAKYASDYFHGEAQGLDLNDPQKWIPITVRMADLVKTSAAMQRQFDNHKMVLFDRERYTYIPRGTKLSVAGSIWLCTNPENISSGDGVGVFQRCNTTWNHLDFYGNVLKEPFVFESEIARANAADPQYNMPIVKGYFNIKCQYNEETAQIDDNTRFLFGKSCYVASGVSDFEQEFTGDDSSVRFLNFTVRRDEVNNAIDDRENRVAGGLLFSWEVAISGQTTVEVGKQISLTASSRRNGESVESSDSHPISYIWASSDESVATVDENGVVTAISDGECAISAILAQNDKISTSTTISVASTQGEIVFETTPPEKLSAYEEIELTVVPPTGGAKVWWSFSGATPESFAALWRDNVAKISCWGGSVEPLIVTAHAGSKSVTATIQLVGI